MVASVHRETLWSQVDCVWDMVVIGGGITGAAIFHEAARSGVRVLLVEQRDYAWGTSSRSSKLVHGGFRYLNQGQFRLVRDSVRQRRQLLSEAPGLVTPLGFMLAKYHDDAPAWVYQLGLAVYDAMALQWNHQRYDRAQFSLLAPHVRQDGLHVGLRCLEATTDDARLVFRLIREGELRDGVALNYVQVTELLREADAVVGVRIRDGLTDRTADVRARVVVNATGAWVDQLRGHLAAPPRMRPLRGSHLVFPGWRFPIAQVIAFRHPLDRRFVSVVPWEDVTLVGTTDLEHDQPLATEPAITPDEVAYLMAGLADVFPELGLTLHDIVATYSGVRPVIHTGKADPSREARDHLVVEEHGLVTVTGGKLTTFRLVARDALALARKRIPRLQAWNPALPALEPVRADVELPLPRTQQQRLIGRYGVDAPVFVAEARTDELHPIPGTSVLWAELRWAARHEAVVHLDDLLLRRVRLGVTMPEGGAAWLPQIRALCQDELGWDDTRWNAEVERYRTLWRNHYGLPPASDIPDWHTPVAHARARRIIMNRKRQRQRRLVGLLATATFALTGLGLRQRRRRRIAA